MWTNSDLDYGDVKAGASLTSIHTYHGDKVVREVSVSCPCIRIQKTNKTIQATWNTRSDIPESYVSVKYINIVYADKTVDEISLKAKLIK